MKQLPPEPEQVVRAILSPPANATWRYNPLLHYYLRQYQAGRIVSLDASR